MSEIETAANALGSAFDRIAASLSGFAEAALRAATAIHEFHRANLLCIRRDYVNAGKPYGNGYAPMMRWWRRQHPELFETVA